MKDMREIASLLDDTVKKGEQIDEKRKALKKAERQKKRRAIKKAGHVIKKGLSFNPFNIRTVDRNMDIYNPYRAMPDGSFAPYEPDYWEQQGRAQTDAHSQFYREARDPEGYREVREYYEFLKPRNFQKSLYKTVEETVEKAKVAQPGEIHEWNGVKFQKQSNGKWIPVHDGAQKDHPIEQDRNQKISKLEQELKQRKEGKREEPNIDDRAKKQNERVKDLERKETEVGSKEQELKERELETREADLENREKELKEKDKDKKEVKDGVYNKVDLSDDIEIPDQHTPAADIDKEVEENHRLNAVDDIFHYVKDGKVVGHLGLDDEGSVKGVYVDEDQRRQGIAEKMYEHVADELGSVSSDDLDAMESNAKKMWEKLKDKYPDRVSGGSDGEKYTLEGKKNSEKDKKSDSETDKKSKQTDQSKPNTNKKAKGDKGKD